jgi:hypothetical protein
MVARPRGRSCQGKTVTDRIGMDSISRVYCGTRQNRASQNEMEMIGHDISRQQRAQTDTQRWAVN